MPQKSINMKKLFITLLSVSVFAIAANAQEATPAADVKQPTKEEKQKMKEKQEADLAAAFKEIGLTDEQVSQIKAAMDEAGQKNKAIRTDANLSDEDKKAKIQEVNDAKNARIKEIMGEEKYRQFNAIRKKQKEAAAADVKKD
jgi:Spy/CpxP family protein refolding chaperone